jgi:hypothetical protein
MLCDPEPWDPAVAVLLLHAVAWGVFQWQVVDQHTRQADSSDRWAS